MLEHLSQAIVGLTRELRESREQRQCNLASKDDVLQSEARIKAVIQQLSVVQEASEEDRNILFALLATGRAEAERLENIDAQH